ncbi:MAG: beta-N-acetylhexosaminidase [Melioribacteraceae bacterium]|nr:beta-N-acetylhexosaminidase [Melioribacteraceae bacterium]
MKKIISFFITITVLLMVNLSAQNVSIIPQPNKIEMNGEVTSLKTYSSIDYDSNNQEIKLLAEYLSNSLKETNNVKIEPISSKTVKKKPFIKLIIDEYLPNPESYKLNIERDEITILGKTGAGIFYGIQSLLQLLTVSETSNDTVIPIGIIADSPRFTWRGAHLDVCRHFFPVSFIKKYIDILAMYKLNTFHFHLTEDQGWRIELKKYPKLTQIGAWRREADGSTYGGFYTQDELREIVEYAKTKYITVVPEIEMPGHSVAALSAHPEFSCTGGPFEVINTWGVFDDIYCAGNDQVFEFLQDVLTEVMEIFPSRYIHIGGDEAPKKRWKECEKCQARIKKENLKDEHELQSYFIHRIEEFVNSKGRIIIGWDEILEGGLAPNAAVMSWRGIEGGIAAAKSKHFAVMSPVSHCYFDYYQAKSGEPKAIGGYISLEKVYSYEPVPKELTEEEAKFILGAQANLWTEYMLTTEQVEYMLLPRLCALSEVVWSAKEQKDFQKFNERMKHHYKLLSAKGINYRAPRE